ncbi:hypothetical protein [Flavobacterium columnare]|nr:hypothetical protein [Flavobacterium columnare]
MKFSSVVSIQKSTLTENVFGFDGYFTARLLTINFLLYNHYGAQ